MPEEPNLLGMLWVSWSRVWQKQDQPMSRIWRGPTNQSVKLQRKMLKFLRSTLKSCSVARQIMMCQSLRCLINWRLLKILIILQQMRKSILLSRIWGTLVQEKVVSVHKFTNASLVQLTPTTGWSKWYCIFGRLERFQLNGRLVFWKSYQRKVT